MLWCGVVWCAVLCCKMLWCDAVLCCAVVLYGGGVALCGVQSVLKRIQLEDDGSFGMFTVRVTKNVGATPGEPFLGKTQWECQGSPHSQGHTLRVFLGAEHISPLKNLVAYPVITSSV